jgi:hypothetical protein
VLEPVARPVTFWLGVLQVDGQRPVWVRSESVGCAADGDAVDLVGDEQHRVVIHGDVPHACYRRGLSGFEVNDVIVGAVEGLAVDVDGGVGVDDLVGDFGANLGFGVGGVQCPVETATTRGQRTAPTVDRLADGFPPLVGDLLDHGAARRNPSSVDLSSPCQSKPLRTLSPMVPSVWTKVSLTSAWVGSMYFIAAPRRSKWMSSLGAVRVGNGIGE